MRVRTFVAIGSNAGDRHAHCAAARTMLDRLPETQVLRVSPLIETEPAEGAAGGPFLNGVAELTTALSPRELLDALRAVEAALGRPTRHPPGAARTIDLDILLYGDRVVREAGLDIPHPRMARRRFVLEPLVAIAPDARHPVLDASAADLLRGLDAAGAPPPGSDAS
ncbi:MAG: 2-amino-4-hydroxy-6-hydroxymethyldihydropteridine diphosphokinase [Zetaproteobacteria bacterium]|nr:MAG: 2-amino-4-hydroxy-6-hydroxymethyldihydropteridine diphosphokinase [Zetaproteobacteria bacterium]